MQIWSFSRIILSAALLLAVPGAAFADDSRGSASGMRGSAAGNSVKTSSKIVVSEPWARPTFGKQTVGVVYMKLSNPTDKAVAVTTASTPRAGRVEIHTHKMENGIMKMRKLDVPLAVPAGQTVMLKPGGLHFMLFKIKSKIKVGETVPVTLTLDDGTAQTVEARVMNKGPQTRGSNNGQHRGSGSGATPTT